MKKNSCYDVLTMRVYKRAPVPLLTTYNVDKGWALIIITSSNEQWALIYLFYSYFNTFKRCICYLNELLRSTGCHFNISINMYGTASGCLSLKIASAEKYAEILVIDLDIQKSSRRHNYTTIIQSLFIYSIPTNKIFRDRASIYV